MGLNVLDIFHKLKMWCVPFTRNKSLLAQGRGGVPGRAVHKITVTATTYPKNQNLKMSAIATALITREFSQLSRSDVASCPLKIGIILEA